MTTRLYVYTWVTAFDEESEPCPISADVLWQSGMTVTLSGFQATPAGRNITKSDSGACGVNLSKVIELPVRMEKIS